MAVPSFVPSQFRSMYDPTGGGYPFDPTANGGSYGAGYTFSAPYGVTTDWQGNPIPGGSNSVTGIQGNPNNPSMNAAFLNTPEQQAAMAKAKMLQGQSVRNFINGQGYNPGIQPGSPPNGMRMPARAPGQRSPISTPGPYVTDANAGAGSVNNPTVGNRTPNPTGSQILRQYQFATDPSSGGGSSNPNSGTIIPGTNLPNYFGGRADPGWNSQGGYFAGGPPQTTPPPPGQTDIVSPRSPLYNQNIGPSLLASGPGVNPNANYGQSWQNYSNPSDMLYNQYLGSQFSPQSQAIWNQVGGNINNFQNKYQQYTDVADQLYSGDAWRNNAYYTPEEQNNMIRENQFQSGMATPEDFSRTYFSPEEQAKISGDPYAGLNYFNDRMASAYNDQDIQEGRTFDALAGQDQAIRGAVGDYRVQGQGALDEGAGALRKSAYDPGLQANTSQLGLSNDFSQNYNFGQADLSDLENLAGKTSGDQIRANYEDIARRAAAEGNTSPMALAAEKQQAANDAASKAANAAIAARVQGRGLQLSTMANKEGMRLGAEQSKEGIRLSGAEKAADIQQGAENSILANRLGFSGNLAGLSTGAEQYLGGARLAAYQNLGTQRQGLNQFTAGMGGQFATQGDTSASNRAGAIASQRTGQENANINTKFGQNFDTNRQLAAGYTNVGNQRIGANQEQRGYFAGQSAANAGALQNSTNAAANWYTNWQNTGQNAANAYGSYDLNRRNQQLQGQQAIWNRQYQMGSPIYGG